MQRSHVHEHESGPKTEALQRHSNCTNGPSLDSYSTCLGGFFRSFWEGKLQSTSEVPGRLRDRQGVWRGIGGYLEGLYFIGFRGRV